MRLSYAIAEVENGEIVEEAELIKDENDTADKEVEKLLGKEGMVVVGV